MKKIIIMGATSGIGEALTEAFASRGVKVGIAGRNEEKLEQFKKKYPECIEYEVIDVNTKEGAKRLKSLIHRMGGMDIYMHISGIGYDNPPMDPEREVSIAQTNCVGFARMISTAYCWFRDNGRPGQIAALTSVGGTKGIGSMTAYSASKKFDHAYLQGLRQLIYHKGLDIAVTDLRPGWIDTPLLIEGERYPLKMDLDDVVPQILKAVAKKQRVAVIDWRWRLLAGVWSLLPGCLWEKMYM